ncbi:MAG: hypothetical protein IJZ57_10150 [Clostridia bacterium]|nr:hypothetical protein [Clostridia bacterium]
MENKNEMNFNTVTEEKTNANPEKKKSKIKTVLLFLPLIALIVIAILLSVGGDTSSDASLGFTLEEFVERYNETVDVHLKDDSDTETYEKVQGWLKLDMDYFIQAEEDERYYCANYSDKLGYIAYMDESGEKVQAITYKFTNDLTEAQLEQFLIFCKWFHEAVKPDMGSDYYTDTLVETIEKGEVHKDGLAYFWDDEDGYYSYGIYYVAQ